MTQTTATCILSVSSVISHIRSVTPHILFLEEAIVRPVCHECHKEDSGEESGEG